MNRKSQFSNWLTIHGDQLNKLIRDSRKRLTRGLIHDIRVEIKKLRIAFYLMDHSDMHPGRNDPYLRTMTAIFSRAGAVRDIQIQRKLLTPFKRYHITGIIDHLEKSEIKKKKILSDYIAKTDLKKLDGNLKSLVHSARKQNDLDLIVTASRLIESEFRFIKRAIGSANDDKKLHRIRISLRTLLELDLITNIIGHKPVNDILTNELEQLNNIAGKWHDLQILLTTLRSYRRVHRTGPGYVTTFKDLQQRERRQKGRVINRILRLIA